MAIKKILLLVAMKKEALPIIKKMEMEPINSILDPDIPAEIYQAETEMGKIILVVSGKCPIHKVDRIGTGLIPLTLEAIKAFSPDLIINVGTGGGFKKRGAQPGDIYISSQKVKYHDRLFFPDQFFLQYGIGSYPCVEISHMAKKLGFKAGIISTGSSMIASLAEENQMEENEASVKEMEAAGIAEIAQLKKVPFIALKIITDLVDTEECPQNQFTNNFDKLINHLADKTSQLCFSLLGQELKLLNKNDEESNMLKSKL